MAGVVVVSCRARAGSFRDNVGRAATRSVFAAAFCIVAIVKCAESKLQLNGWYLGEVTMLTRVKLGWLGIEPLPPASFIASSRQHHTLSTQFSSHGVHLDTPEGMRPTFMIEIGLLTTSE